MNGVLLLPWKFDKRSAAGQLVSEFLSKLEPHARVELVTPPRALADAADEAQFLHKEIQKLSTRRAAFLFLDERGTEMESEAFAGLLSKWEGSAVQTVCFCMGGAYGLPALDVRSLQHRVLSLSKGTLSHEVALIVLLEQLYRACLIQKNHPYHHGARSALMTSLADERAK